MKLEVGIGQLNKEQGIKNCEGKFEVGKVELRTRKKNIEIEAEE